MLSDRLCSNNEVPNQHPGLSQSYFFRVETSVSIGFGASGFEPLLTSMVSDSGGERQCQDKERAWLSFHFPSLLSTCLISFSLPINGYSAPT